MQYDPHPGFKAVTVSKFQLPVILPEYKTENEIYKTLKRDTPMRYLPVEGNLSKFYVLFYNRLFLFSLEWADIVEKNIALNSSAANIIQRDDFRTDVELVLETNATKVTEAEVSKINPLLYGFYGVMVRLDRKD